MRCIKIVYWGGKGQIKEFTLDRNVPRAVIGRDPGCEIRIPSPLFTPRHAIVEWDGDAAYVAYVRFPPGNQSDLNVDGESLGNERIELMIGSELAIGDQVFAMTCMSEDEVELPPADGLGFSEPSRSQIDVDNGMRNDADDAQDWNRGSSRGQAPSRGDDWTTGIMVRRDSLGGKRRLVVMIGTHGGMTAGLRRDSRSLRFLRSVRMMIGTRGGTAARRARKCSQMPEMLGMMMLRNSRSPMAEMLGMKTTARRDSRSRMAERLGMTMRRDSRNLLRKRPADVRIRATNASFI